MQSARISDAVLPNSIVLRAAGKRSKLETSVRVKSGQRGSRQACLLPNTATCSRNRSRFSVHKPDVQTRSFCWWPRIMIFSRPTCDSARRHIHSRAPRTGSLRSSFRSKQGFHKLSFRNEPDAARTWMITFLATCGTKTVPDFSLGVPGLSVSYAAEFEWGEHSCIEGRVLDIPR